MLSLKEGLSELQNALPSMSTLQPGTSQHSFHGRFSFVAFTPQTQWCSLTHSWLVLIFHFLCQVTVGCYFMFSSGGDCSLLFFQDLLFGNVPFHLVTMEVNVCTVGFFLQLLLLLHLCGAPGEEQSAEGEASHLPVTQRLAPTSPPSTGLKEEKFRVCRQIHSGK